MFFFFPNYCRDVNWPTDGDILEITPGFPLVPPSYSSTPYPSMPRAEYGSACICALTKEKQGLHWFWPEIIGLQKLASVIPVLTSWVVSPLTRCQVTAETTNCAYILVLLNTLLGIFGHSLIHSLYARYASFVGPCEVHKSLAFTSSSKPCVSVYC